MKKFMNKVAGFFDKLGTGAENLHKVKSGSFWTSAAVALISAFIPGLKIAAIVFAGIAGVMFVDSCIEGTTQYGSKICDNISDKIYEKTLSEEAEPKVEKVAKEELVAQKEEQQVISDSKDENLLIKNAEAILASFPEMDPEDALSYAVKGYTVETLRAKLETTSSTESIKEN